MLLLILLITENSGSFQAPRRTDFEPTKESCTLYTVHIQTISSKTGMYAK